MSSSLGICLFPAVVFVAWTWLELVTESGTQWHTSTGNFVTNHDRPLVEMRDEVLK